MIRAEVHSDDYRHEVKFDATAWFEQASDQDVIALADCGWGGDYPADHVALWYEDLNEAVERLLNYCRDSDATGFECHVEEKDALAWLRAHRPNLLAQLEETS